MIEAIEVKRGAIPLTETVPPQLWVSEWSNQLFVKVTASGNTGWGEVLPAAANTREPYIAMIERFAENLLGEDETEIRKIWNLMCRWSFTGGYGITTGAISGIDIALWDLLGKKMGKPVSELLEPEEPLVPKLSRYVSLSRYAHSQQLRTVVGTLLEKGYRSIKLHQSAADTFEGIKLLRDSFGRDFELMADLNCGFSYRAAEEFMHRVEPYELKWIEEPVWPPDDFESLAKLNKLGPVAAGENCFSIHEFQRLLKLDALTFYQPDVAKCGGITAFTEILRAIKDHEARIALHSRPHNGWVGLVAGAHVASCVDAGAIVESPTNEIPGKYFSFTGKLGKSSIQVDGPGLGISPVEPLPESTGSPKLLRFH
jgi:L-alanine-DL-glutamate epimerase-like enolase superfamily enzyme